MLINTNNIMEDFEWVVDHVMVYQLDEQTCPQLIRRIMKYDILEYIQNVDILAHNDSFRRYLC